MCTDLNGFAPRLGLTWAPGSDGKTTIRTSFGVFYNWLSTNVYEQTLANRWRPPAGGQHRQSELPRHPGNSGTVAATNKYLLAADLRMERYTRFSTAVDRTLSPKVRVSFDLRYRPLRQSAART